MSFDAIAPWYRTLEAITFGRSLQRARLACLGKIGSPRRALVVGEGNGRFLLELVRANPALKVECIDASELMLRLARSRIQAGIATAEARVVFLQRDLASWTPPPRRYDLIVTHFFLDCFPRAAVEAIVAKLAASATDDAQWLVADFNIPDEGVGRLQARMWLPILYAFFRIATGIEGRDLIDPSPFLCAQNFQLRSELTFRQGMLKSQLWRRQCRDD